MQSAHEQKPFFVQITLTGCAVLLCVALDFWARPALLSQMTARVIKVTCCCVWQKQLTWVSSGKSWSTQCFEVPKLGATWDPPCKLFLKMSVRYPPEEILALPNNAVLLLLGNGTPHRPLLNTKRCWVLVHNAFICSCPQSSCVNLVGSFVFNCVVF